MTFSKYLDFYSKYFARKEVIFIRDDFVNCAERLAVENINTVFSHSWMFDDCVMKKPIELFVSRTSLQCIVTSRPLDEVALDCSQLRDVSLIYLTLGWNTEASFCIYSRNTSWVPVAVHTYERFNCCFQYLAINPPIGVATHLPYDAMNFVSMPIFHCEKNGCSLRFFP
ncbi:unnamed protein product [Trypanosoma congolense IL3000]|uniref:WGS project CAEQ00000000 data, annotated contig 1745 n=1 Tax=Trypanosoma congolense (strain IL3000) TaxID=1068625 RepID=F9W8L5_TRYCI|nr:unnamed protein product [Trypanosoma congolense IL3000]